MFHPANALVFCVVGEFYVTGISVARYCSIQISFTGQHAGVSLEIFIGVDYASKATEKRSASGGKVIDVRTYLHITAENKYSNTSVMDPPYG